MKKTLLASALAVAFGLSGVASANTTIQKTEDDSSATNNSTSTSTNTNSSTNTKTYTHTTNTNTTNTKTHTNANSDSSTNQRSGYARADAARSAALNNGSSASFSNAFNVTTATASSSLHGMVTGNKVFGPVSYTHLTLPTIYSV